VGESWQLAQRLQSIPDRRRYSSASSTLSAPLEVVVRETLSPNEIDARTGAIRIEARDTEALAELLGWRQLDVSTSSFQSRVSTSQADRLKGSKAGEAHDAGPRNSGGGSVSAIWVTGGGWVRVAVVFVGAISVVCSFLALSFESRAAAAAPLGSVKIAAQGVHVNTPRSDITGSSRSSA